MPKHYNTHKTDNLVVDEQAAAIRAALSACVHLTPAEEERILPSIQVGERYHDPDEALDKLDPTATADYDCLELLRPSLMSDED